MSSTITAEEQQKYWAIFSGLHPADGFLTGEQAGQVLAKSGLSEEKLADVWDRADIDQDGRLDFEEFCVAMRLIFDLMNGVYVNVPSVLPDFLVPGSKQHLITANSALETGLDIERPDYDDDHDDQPGLKDNFDWYMSPTDKKSYESIYSANADRRGGVKFDHLTELFSTLSVPDREIQNAWTLVNPKLADAIGKDQTLAFLHILNQRHQGSRIPKNIPPSLRATFQKSEISYNTSKYDKDGNLKGASTSKSNAFGGDYMNKLGIGSRGASKAATDNTGDIKDGDWELVRLKRELADLESQIASAESATKSAPADNGDLLVKRELEQLLAFKTAELDRLDKADGLNASSGFKGIQADIEMFRQQLDSLKEYLQERQQFLASLEAQR